MLNNAPILSELSGAVLTVTLPDPASGGLSRQSLNAFASVLTKANTDPNVNVIMIIGGESQFCVGLDLNEFLVADQLDGLASALSNCFLALANLHKPLVAIVEGPAIGLGASIVCHADVVVATPFAAFEAPFVALGLLPEAGSTMIMPDRIGYLRSIRFFCLGESIDASEALSIGLVTEIVETDPRKRGAELSKRLSRLPSDSVQTTRKLLRGDLADVRRRIQLEISACRQRLNDPSLRRRVALFAGAARAGTRRETANKQRNIA